MATRPLLVDDLDGGTDNIHTHQFGLDGLTYAIDLSETNLDQLRTALAPFITVARLQPKTTPTAHPRRSTATGRQVRQWWQANGDTLRLPTFRPSGAIPRQVHDAYSRSRTASQPQR